ncbi:MAG TPA: hypothetical protein VLR26_17085 [Frankiaceae bacterium]|nr:hypothetical protein [Frankiaceae bacterium]
MGATATITRNWTAGQSVALVMEKAPDRGAATVLVDGVRKRRWTPTPARPPHRAVTGTYRTPAGIHSVEIVERWYCGAGHASTSMRCWSADRPGRLPRLRR